MVDQKHRFTEIFDKNLFCGRSSRSGEGSSLEQTDVLRAELPKLLLDFDIKTILDAPCGDWNWMKELDLSNVNYLGVDIVDKIITDNHKYVRDNVNFVVKDIISDELPKVDLIFCRDCFVHLTYDNIFKALKNFKSSGSKYLLTTTFPKYEHPNIELVEKDIWRALNLERPPFSFPSPIRYIVERDFKSPFNIKTSALWNLEEVSV